jgi:hypothetical protein
MKSGLKKKRVFPATQHRVCPVNLSIRGVDMIKTEIM